MWLRERGRRGTIPAEVLMTEETADVEKVDENDDLELAEISVL